MHDLNKPQCSKLPPHWHPRLDLLPSFSFFLLLVYCPSSLLWFLLLFAKQWTLLCGFSFFILYLIWNFLSPCTWLALEMLKSYIFFYKRCAEWFSLYPFFYMQGTIEILPPSHFFCPLFHFETSQNIVLFLKIKVINLLMFLDRKSVV